jgi:hypothetical protein
MPRWLWFAPLSVLLLLLGVWAFRMGWIAATISETDVISAYAARYLEARGPGASPSDCAARPGRMRGVWIVVVCTAPDGTRHVYAADRFGREVRQRPQAPAATRPET